MNKKQTSVIFLLALMHGSCLYAWPAAQPPQFGFFPATADEEPDVVSVEYTSDWPDPDSTDGTSRIKYQHDGLLVSEDMILINSPPSDITVSKVEKYRVESSVMTPDESLPLQQLHRGSDFVILELQCRVENASLHGMAFDENVRERIDTDGVAVSIFYRDASNILTKAVQPLYNSWAYRCNRGPDVCIGYLNRGWAETIRDEGPRGSPVFADFDGTRKIIGLLENDRWLKSAGGYRGSRSHFVTHVRSINNLENFIVGIVGTGEANGYDWVDSNDGDRPKGSFVAGRNNNNNVYICSVEYNGSSYPGVLGRLNPSLDEGSGNPSGCIITPQNEEPTVATEYRVLRGRLNYQWSTFSTSNSLQAFSEPQSSKTLCRSKDEGTRLVGWLDRESASAMCVVTGENGAKQNLIDFEVLYPVSEKPTCSDYTPPAPLGSTTPPGSAIVSTGSLATLLGSFILGLLTFI